MHKELFCEFELKENITSHYQLYVPVSIFACSPLYFPHGPIMRSSFLFKVSRKVQSSFFFFQSKILHCPQCNENKQTTPMLDSSVHPFHKWVKKVKIPFTQNFCDNTQKYKVVLKD